MIAKYLVVIRFGRRLYDVELSASSADRASRRALMSIRMSKRDFTTRGEVVSVEEVQP